MGIPNCTTKYYTSNKSASCRAQQSSPRALYRHSLGGVNSPLRFFGLVIWILAKFDPKFEDTIPRPSSTFPGKFYGDISCLSVCREVCEFIRQASTAVWHRGHTDYAGSNFLYPASLSIKCYNFAENVSLNPLKSLRSETNSDGTGQKPGQTPNWEITEHTDGENVMPPLQHMTVMT